jgi:hypothetical protein
MLVARSSLFRAQDRIHGNITFQQPSQKGTICMRRSSSVLFLIVVIALGHLACSKSNSAASLSKEDKYKLFYAASQTNDDNLKKQVIKKLGIGDGESTFPDHEFFVAFIDWWMKTDDGNKFSNQINTPEKARDYLDKNLPK